MENKELEEAREKIEELESRINQIDNLVRSYFGELVIDGICYEYVSDYLENNGY